jgi:hypothetical protein
MVCKMVCLVLSSIRPWAEPGTLMPPLTIVQGQHDVVVIDSIAVLDHMTDNRAMAVPVPTVPTAV